MTRVFTLIWKIWVTLLVSGICMAQIHLLHTTLSRYSTLWLILKEFKNFLEEKQVSWMIFLILNFFFFVFTVSWTEQILWDICCSFHQKRFIVEVLDYWGRVFACLCKWFSITRLPSYQERPSTPTKTWPQRQNLNWKFQ